MQPKQNKRLVPIAKLLRKQMTPQERHLWYDFLKHYPIPFRRQKILGSYVVDFYAASVKLAVELDGSQHYQPEQQKSGPGAHRLFGGLWGAGASLLQPCIANQL